MIVKLKYNVTDEEVSNFKKFFESKGYDILDVSSQRVHVYGIIGDTSKIDIEQVKCIKGVDDATRIQAPFKLTSKTLHPEPTIIDINGIKIGEATFTVMAGPCSVESKEQIDSIAKECKASGALILRGGVFKPRTSPYSFQGLKEEGLKMLYEAGKKYDMPIITEIVDKELIPLYEKYVDIIQVGARNMQNFELLKALGKTKKPILLKRGPSNTIEEWLLAAEYILVGGNPNVILCERGIKTFEKYTRNTLDLSAVLAAKQLSHLPVIVDPSHAAGRFDMIEDLSKASLAVGADGIIVEVHNNPELALSDGGQSLKPKRFKHMMETLRKISPIIGKKM
jgi:3-deoxy-7-phosphoheptulonate synthase